MTKTELRDEARRRLAAMDDALYRTVGIQPREGHYLPETTRTLLSFLPRRREPDVMPLIRAALASGATVAAPVVYGADMEFRRIFSAEGPFRTGAFGIREPLSDAEIVFPAPEGIASPAFPVLILVPGLAFTVKGGRLGQGGGYYDRFLSRFLASFPERRSEITLAGVCLTAQIVNEITLEGHDIPVDCLYTEKGIILCTER